jgi:hypothetical protein
MIVNGQCFRCYDATMFQYFGQTLEYSRAKNLKEYVSKLSDGITVVCVSCGSEVKYVKFSEGKWREEAANGRS